MRHPTKEQSDGAQAQKAGDFGLTRRALAFARVYAETPHAPYRLRRGRPASVIVPGARTCAAVSCCATLA